MREIEVSKKKLITTLEKNSKTHKADFEIAWEAFRKKAIKNSVSIIDSLKSAPKGAQVNLHIGLSAPQDHSEDYQRALEMAEWHNGDFIKLSEAEFTQYVQDNWGWKNQFSTTNQFYTGEVSPSSK